MGNKKRKLILSLFVTFTIIILFFIGKNVLFYTHQLTPEGEKLLNTERIQKDVEYIFQDKYKFHYKLSIFNLKNIIHLSLEPNRTVLKRAFQNESDKVIQIVLTDKKVRGTDINVHEEGKVIVTNQAIQFLIYFIHRDYDPTIKAVNAFVFVNINLSQSDHIKSEPLQSNLFPYLGEVWEFGESCPEGQNSPNSSSSQTTGSSHPYFSYFV
jgi:hypothetical protein